LDSLEKPMHTNVFSFICNATALFQNLVSCLLRNHFKGIIGVLATRRLFQKVAGVIAF